MFLATICLFTMYVCRVTLHFSHARPPVHVHGPLTLGREAVTMGMALGDGLLQEVWFSDSSEDEGSPRKSYVDKASPTEAAAEDTEVESWQVFRTIISSGVCTKLIYIFIFKWYEHNFLENFIGFYCTTLYFYYCTNSLFIICNLFFAIFFKLKKC